MKTFGGRILQKFWLAVFCAGATFCASGQALQVELEEFKRLIGEVADLRDALRAQQSKVSALQNEVDRLRVALRESNEKVLTRQGDFATREDLKKLVDSIQEVDRKRDSDKKLILEEIEKLGKTLLAETKKPAPRREPEQTRSAPIEETVITYKIQKGDYISTVIAAYNATLKEKGLQRISLDDVKRVNPNLNVNRIVEGQEIFLPVPGKQK